MIELDLKDFLYFRYGEEYFEPRSMGRYILKGRRILRRCSTRARSNSPFTVLKYLKDLEVKIQSLATQSLSNCRLQHPNICKIYVYAETSQMKHALSCPKLKTMRTIQKTIQNNRTIVIRRGVKILFIIQELPLHYLKFTKNITN